MTSAKPVLLAALALCAPGIVAAQSVPAVAVQQGGAGDAPLLSFSVTEEVRRAPDRASVGAGVTTTAPTAVEAMRLNAAAMERVIAAVRRAGVPQRDIQTSGISLAPQYDYSPQNQGQPPRFIGYQVSNQVRVTTADIANLGRMLDALVAAGGTNIEGPSFFVDRPEEGLDGARERALAAASARAQTYARLAGYRTARLVSLTEGGGYFPQPMPAMRMEAADAVAVTGTRVEPGRVTSGITLSVQYRLER
jgi:uncharacterized protein